jgi:hypothetical protein
MPCYQQLAHNSWIFAMDRGMRKWIPRLAMRVLVVVAGDAMGSSGQIQLSAAAF